MGKWVKGYLKTARNDEGSREVKGSRQYFACPSHYVYIDSSNNHGQEYPDQFKYDYAVSREDKNAAGQKMCLSSL